MFFHMIWKVYLLNSILENVNGYFLEHTFHHPEQFGAPVADSMTSKLEVIAPTAPIDALLPIFRADLVAIVVDGDEFLGLITKVDLINYLRLGAA